jgi:hypothetical protein
VSAFPRRVLADIDLLWPPGNTAFPLFVRKGSLVDAAPGSALEAAYGGPSNLEDVPRGGSDDVANKAWLTN